jgi:amidase
VLREQVDRLDHLRSLGAVVARDDDAAVTRAEELDDAFAKGGPVGPLHGLPVTVKDWIDVAGLPCVGEGDDADRRPGEDAPAVARLRAAGAVIVAKTNVNLDHRLFGPCRHPTDPTRSPGGSSSGEASLVAAGGSPLGLGSDSGGSIRLPAAWCGTVGLKPTFGRVPLTGHFPRLGSLHDGRTVIGPLARTVADVALALGVLSGPDGRDAACAPVPLGDASDVAGLRVAWFVDDGAGRASPEVARGLAGAVGALGAAGAAVVDGAVPSHVDVALDITSRYWARRALDGPGADDLLWDWDRFRRRMLVAADAFDVMVCPAAAGEAPRRQPLKPMDFVFTLPPSLTGWPVVVVPVGTGPAGLPLAVQVVGRPWCERQALAAAAVVEAAAPYV